MPADGSCQAFQVLEPASIEKRKDLLQELERPEEQRRIARSFRNCAAKMDRAVQDGMFLTQHKNVIFLLDQDVLRTYLQPGIRSSGDAGLVIAFLNHKSVYYAIPPGSFEELLDWLGPLRQYLLDLRAAWSTGARESIEARLRRHLRLDDPSASDARSAGTSALEGTFDLVQRMDRLVSNDRFKGFAGNFDEQFAQMITAQLAMLRDRVIGSGPHELRDRRDGMNVSSAKTGSIDGCAATLLLTSRTRDVCDLVGALKAQHLDLDDLGGFLGTRDEEELTDLSYYPVLGMQRIAVLWSTDFFSNPVGSINQLHDLAGISRHVDHTLIEQAVFRELAALTGAERGEAAVANAQRPTLTSRLEEVIRPLLESEFELKKLLQMERSLIGDSSGVDLAEVILKTLSRIAQKLLGQADVDLQFRGEPSEFCEVSAFRRIGSLNPTTLFHLELYPPRAAQPAETIIIRWPTACGEHRFFEALGRVFSLATIFTGPAQPIRITDDDQVPSDAILIYTNKAPFAVGHRSVFESARKSLRYIGRNQLLRRLRSAVSEPTALEIDEILQIVMQTPAGDIYFDVVTVGLNENRFVSVLTEGLGNQELLARLIAESSPGWIEPSETNIAIGDAMILARQFLNGAKP